MDTTQTRAIKILSGMIDSCTMEATREARRASAIAAITAGPGPRKFTEQYEAYHGALNLCALVLTNHYTDNGIARHEHTAWLRGADVVEPVLFSGGV